MLAAQAARRHPAAPVKATSYGELPWVAERVTGDRRAAPAAAATAAPGRGPRPARTRTPTRSRRRRAARAAAGPPGPGGARSPSATSHGIARWSSRWTPRRRSASSIAHQADRVAGRARAARPADAVDVVLGVPRQLEVDDVGQRPRCRAREPRRRSRRGTRISPALNASSAFVRSHWARSEWIAVAATPWRSSHEASRDAASFVRVNTSTWCQSPSRTRWREQLLLAVAIDRVDELAHGLGGGPVAGDLDRLGVVEDRAGEALDVVAERRREQQRLLAARSAGRGSGGCRA